VFQSDHLDLGKSPVFLPNCAGSRWSSHLFQAEQVQYYSTLSYLGVGTYEGLISGMVNALYVTLQVRAIKVNVSQATHAVPLRLVIEVR
jgi:hypothetical protein